MKLVINYDFINAIRNMKEPLGPLKIIRNEKRVFIKYDLPLFLAIDFALGYGMPGSIITLLSQYGIIITLELLSQALAKKMVGDDLYTLRSYFGLRLLASQLNDLNVSTNYDMLLQSEVYEKKYKIEFNERKLPELLERKYILVPSYSFDGQVQDTSILQEHVVGSKRYVLSIDEPKRETKLAYAMI